MEFQSKARTLPFLTARARLANRYNIDIETDDFIERAFYVWRDIGNIAPVDKDFQATVPQDLVIKLPSDCYFVNSVTNQDLLPDATLNTARGNTRYDSTGMKKQEDPDASLTSTIGAARASTKYNHGINVPFTTGDGFIKLSNQVLANRPVIVAYSAMVVDGDGLPSLNDREIDAIAANLALQEGEKQLFQGKRGAAELVQYLKAEADRLFQAAKLPDKLSDGGIDKILDIKTSWGRKVFGQKFNLIP